MDADTPVMIVDMVNTVVIPGIQHNHTKNVNNDSVMIFIALSKGALTATVYDWLSKIDFDLHSHYMKDIIRQWFTTKMSCC